MSLPKIKKKKPSKPFYYLEPQEPFKSYQEIRKKKPAVAAKVRLFLDDEREAPTGFLLFKTIPSLMDFIKNNLNQIELVSLDGYLGFHEPLGTEVFDLLEDLLKKVKLEEDLFPILIHSGSKDIKASMMLRRKKFWRHLYDSSIGFQRRNELYDQPIYNFPCSERFS